MYAGNNHTIGDKASHQVDVQHLLPEGPFLCKVLLFGSAYTYHVKVEGS